MILTNAIKYFPKIPHMESSSFCKLHFAQCFASKIPCIWIVQDMNFSLSIDLNASWPKIGQYGTRFRILINNFGDPLGLIFQNLIGGPSMGL